MATEIHRSPVAETLPQGTSVHEATDVISGILGNRPEETPSEPEAPIESLETPDEVSEDGQEAQDAPRTDAEETAPEPAPEPEASEPGGDAEEIELEPAQLAAMLGLEESDLVVDDQGGLSFHAKVDGEVQSVALGDLRDSYQLRRTAEQRLSKLGDERKAFETERTDALQKLNSQAETMAQAIGVIENEYASQWAGVDWGKLREEDPTTYSLQRTDFDDRKRRLNDYKQQYNQHMQAVHQRQVLTHQETLQEGIGKLQEIFSGPDFAKAPTWDDGAKQELAKFMLSEGIPEQMLATTEVWQAFRWAREAMLYRQMKVASEASLKKVVKLPKVTKPGTPTTKQQAKRSKLKDARARQRKEGGTVNATAERISSILRGS